MHWLKRFRRDYRRKDGETGISRKELAKMVKLRFGKCSEREASPKLAKLMCLNCKHSVWCI